MSVINIIRRTASQVVVGITQRYHYRSSALFSTVVNCGVAASTNFFRSSAVSTKRNSSGESLLKAIHSEILRAEESDEVEEEDEGQELVPFNIEDHPGQQTIALTREYQDETIDLLVHLPVVAIGDVDVNDYDDRSIQSGMPFVVRVSKKNGSSLEFCLTAFADDIAIDCLSIRDPNAAKDQIDYEPDFSHLDENLQKAFHEYLEIRGVKLSTTNFLYEYMINKGAREYLMWLKNLKKFIEA